MATAFVMLLISERAVLLEQRRAAGGGRRLSLPVGTGLVADRHFLHAPPTPQELERAIETIEDAVMPARAQLPPDMRLASADPALRALARHAGLAADARWLGLDVVERLFNRLVARAAGRPASQDALPVDGASAARLLILREALHHWVLDGIGLTD